MTLITTIAAPFKYMRKEQLRTSEFVFFLAIDRKWMNKDQAHLLLSRAEREGLIRQDGGVLTPTFDLGGVNIPLGFKPTSDIFDQKDPVSDLMERIATAQERDVSAVASEMNIIIDERFDGHIRPEAAIVLLAKRYSVPFEDVLEDLKKSVVKKA